MTDFKSIPSEFSWRLKNRVTWSLQLKRKLSITNHSVVTKRFSPIQQQRFESLFSKYDTALWNGVCTKQEFIENLYLLDVCNRYLRPGNVDERALDIGCKNWSYLPALYSFRPTAWDGVELDAYRRYWTSHTRRAHGEHMARQFKGCR